MKYRFKKFEGRNAKQEKRMTITKSNSIGFPMGFYEENRIKNFEYVTLFWDLENEAIGIYFNNNGDDKNNFRIIHSKKGYGGSIIVRSFFQANNIDPKIYYGRYEWGKHMIKGVGRVFVIKLERQSNK